MKKQPKRSSIWLIKLQTCKEVLTGEFYDKLDKTMKIMESVSYMTGYDKGKKDGYDLALKMCIDNNTGNVITKN